MKSAMRLKKTPLITIWFMISCASIKKTWLFFELIRTFILICQPIQKKSAFPLEGFIEHAIFTSFSVFKVVAFNYDNVNVAVFLLWMPPTNLRDVGTGKYNVMDFEKYIVLSVVILYLKRDDLRITIFITSASLSFFLNTICSTIHFQKVSKQHMQNWTLRIFVTQCT